jgi:hypothetical protein
MSSDRSTLQRGQPGAPDPQGYWPEPTAPAGRRLPSAPRERKPALAALAALLIVGCALGTGLLVISSGKRVAAVEITREVGAGQRIPLTAMTEVQIASNTGLSYVPWAQAAQVSRFFAAGSIPPGTLLTRSMVASTSTSTAGRSLVGLVLKDGQVPQELAVGDHVDVFEVSDATVACPGAPGTVLSNDAIVTEISTPGADSGNGGAVVVDLAVSPFTAGAVTCAASNGIAGIGVMPAGGQGSTATGPDAGSVPPTSPVTPIVTAPPTTAPPVTHHSVAPRPSPSKRAP